jgi:ubiquinone/menaquinone biosynthesis C-methylase UbiE
MKELSSTYFVQSRRSKNELTRLTIQDRMITTAMGGVLPEQANPTVFRRVLDVGCGTGGWLVEAAQTYPRIALVGIDISKQMIKYARAQAEANQVNDRIEFRVMDALQTLKFPAASFDLVNLRLGVSFLRTWDWPKMLGELLRVTRPGGVVRFTDAGIVPKSNSPALTRLYEMLMCAFFRSGRLFTQESTGLISHLPRLLHQRGYQQVQTKAYQIEYQAGTAAGDAYREDTLLGFRTFRPFIEKWGDTDKVYELLYRRAVDEMHQSDFFTRLTILTVWGSRP